MNALLNNLRSTTCLINNILSNKSVYIARGFKSDLKIKWIRPEKIPSYFPKKSGDGGLEYNVKNDDFMSKYDECRELQDASDYVKRMFTLEFNPQKEIKLIRRNSTMDRVKQHQLDSNSMEANLAQMTSEILYLQQCVTEEPKNGKRIRFLKELVDKRNKYLRKLRKWDYKRFEWVLEKLNITFKPHPQGHIRLERKASLRKLTAIHCDKLRQSKLDAYKQELQNEQRTFFKEKAEKLAFIRAEEIACGVEPTVTEEEIAAAQEKAAQYH